MDDQETYLPPTAYQRGQDFLGQQAGLRALRYLCGYCGESNELRPKDPIKCQSCGHRIMYKKRTEQVIQYEAR